ncbi:conjugal transfer protein TraT [Lelliottia amnigena]|uniref:conjugal transfer protein TraT n=1 Tax=Lelliottia amnigena TaxID=61646 RepID=UPI0020B45F83|nr:conjugal transfer protein TraT [Lelliottia amnigena]
MKTKKTPESPWLHPLPLPDVVHTTAPLLPAPGRVSGGRCYCCGADMKHLFALPESLPLTRLADAAQDAAARLERAKDTLAQLTTRATPQAPAEYEKHTRSLKAARTGMAHASLAARRLALRHIPKALLTDTDPLSEAEHTEFGQLTQPFHLCYLCHAWHALNGFAAAQGVMVWLPDLHPRSVVALNRKALQAVFSTRPVDVREGRRILSELTRHRLPLEERFGGWRPADFADALKRFPPVMRDELRLKMNGVALILTPDSVTDSDVLSDASPAETAIPQSSASPVTQS